MTSSTRKLAYEMHLHGNTINKIVCVLIIYKFSYHLLLYLKQKSYEKKQYKKTFDPNQKYSATKQLGYSLWLCRATLWVYFVTFQ